MYRNSCEPVRSINIFQSTAKIPNETILSSKSKIVSVLLCLLGFVGLAGLHRIYVGKIFSGIFYFFTIGLFSIGTIIDLIQIIMGQFTDNVGCPVRK